MNWGAPLIKPVYCRDPNIYDPFPQLSRSVPGTSNNGTDDPDKVSIGGSATDEDEDDEFSRLKKLREKERLSRWVIINYHYKHLYASFFFAYLGLWAVQ